MVQNKKLAVVIPVYNEAKTIIKVYNQTKNIGIPVIVDDCSIDDTKKILKKKKINFISNNTNKGYEKSIKNGFRYIFRKMPFVDYIATIDADLELPPKNIFYLYKIIKDKKLDIIVGSRTKLNRISEYILNFIFNFKFGLKDPISGLKIYKKNKLKKIFNKISNNLFLVDILLTSYSKKLNIAYKEIKIKKRSDMSRVGSGIKVNLKIIKIALYCLLKKI